MKIELDDGKYTYVNDAQGQRALRYGEPWRDLTGDNFVYCLAARIEELEQQLASPLASPLASTVAPDFPVTEHKLAQLRAGSDADAQLAKMLEQAADEAVYERNEALGQVLHDKPIEVDRIFGLARQEDMRQIMRDFRESLKDLDAAIGEMDPDTLRNVLDDLDRLRNELLEQHKEMEARQQEAEAALENFNKELEA